MPMLALRPTSVAERLKLISARCFFAMIEAKSSWAIPLAVCVTALALFAIWVAPRSSEALKLRIPGTDAAPGGEVGGRDPVQAGQLIPGAGQPADLPGSWMEFRGPQRAGIAPSTPVLSRDWNANPPRELWSLDVGEGYAGVAVQAGRVYLLDYNREAKQSALRCLSLADGREIWRFSYPLTIKRNHGMTRTVPTLTDKYVVAMDSKCNVFCLDVRTGELQWSVSLVATFGATIPEWYAGQCPLVDGDKVILAPGGKEALMVALELATGKISWQTPNPRDWKMTHASIMPLEFAGRRHYVYCASKGVVGVAASDGKLLWETVDWRISIATVPSPVPLPDGKIFLTGGYNAGSMMLQLEVANPLTPALSPSDGERVAEGRERGNADNEATEAVSVRQVFKIPANVFGATQHTPVFKDGHLYGIRADGRFVCLDLAGKVVWTTGTGETFGLGSFLAADDLVFALNDSGKLRLLEVSPSSYRLLGEAKPLSGRESWAPMTLVGTRLLVRDLTRLVCLEVAAK
jgi:outer membrane protein assembly factor BamB